MRPPTLGNILVMSLLVFALLSLWAKGIRATTVFDVNMKYCHLILLFNIIIYLRKQNILNNVHSSIWDCSLMSNVILFSQKVDNQLEKAQGQEVEFHEIKIHFFRRSNYFLIMRSNFFVIFHEVKIPNNDSISWLQHFSWDWNCLIMFFRVLISWLFLQLTNWSWDWN